MMDLQSTCYIYTVTRVTFKFLFEERSDAKALARSNEILIVINFDYSNFQML